VQHKGLKVQQVFKDQPEMLVLIVVFKALKVLRVDKVPKAHKVPKERHKVLKVR